MENNLRQPIITVVGHVDHGKTSILDQIRGTSIQKTEEGGITQKISSTILPRDYLEKRSGEILKKFNIELEIPGLLLIDTPGHAAFVNLRKRGGSIADIAILVIDINEGIKPQTQEVLKILKSNKTPFIIALNKIDNISGWKKSESLLFFDSIKEQKEIVIQNFEEKIYTIFGSLNSYGLTPEIYYKIKDFTRNVAVVPCSARTGEGINEIIAMIIGLSQKFLKERIKSKNESGKGVVLEVKKEKSINYLECILYDGKIKLGDEIAISSFISAESGKKEGGIILAKVRSLLNARPLNKGYEPAEEITAASGIRIQTTSKEEIAPGVPFQVVKDNVDEIKKDFLSEIYEEIKTDDTGIIVKADSLGSLEAIIFLLKQKNFNILKAGIGPITKKDIYLARTLPEEERVILGFNVDLIDDAKNEKIGDIKIITNPVVYKIIEDFEEWKKNKIIEIERRKLSELPILCKIEVLDFVFRNSNPAVFGVRVVEGVLKKELRLINSEDEKIGQVKEIQENRQNIQEAQKGKEVAISIPGLNFERNLKVGEFLYTNISESEFRKFKENKDLLSSEEKSILQEIAKIKRKTNPTWGI